MIGEKRGSKVNELRMESLIFESDNKADKSDQRPHMKTDQLFGQTLYPMGALGRSIKAQDLSLDQKAKLVATVKELDFLYYRLCTKYVGYSHVLQTVLDLVDLCKEIVHNSHKFDYQRIPFNGFRSMVHKFTQLLAYMVNSPICGTGPLVDIMTELRSHSDTIRQVLHSPVHEVPPLEIDRMVDAMHQFSTDERLMSLIFNEVTLFFDIGRLGRFLTRFSFWFIAFVVSDSWISSLWCMLSPSARLRTVREYYRTCPLPKLVHLLSYSQSIWQESIAPFFAYGFGPSVKKFIRVPRQTEWRVRLDIAKQDVILTRNIGRSGPSAPAINCCVLRQNIPKGRVNEFDNVVLIYVMGGGFLSNSIRSTNSFLPALCKKMPGLTIVSVGISLAPEHKFPTQIQETLDVYLWLQQHSQSLRLALGFQPKSFLFSCDSSGAIITMSTLIILNDINNELMSQGSIDQQIVMPLSVVAHVPAFHVVPAIMPSIMLSVKDLILFPTTLTQMCFSYIPNISLNKSIDTTVQLNDPNAWFLNPPDKTKELLRRHEFLFKHPYFSPIFYDRLDELSGVQLHVLACEEDPILDSSIMMLRRWHGKTSMHVSLHLRHAYFYFSAFSTAVFRSTKPWISEAEDVFVARVYESVRSSG